MTKRFRMIAGPNGSGKSTLMRRLATDYAVNFYDVLNADDIFAEVRRTFAFQPRISVEPERLRGYAAASSYGEEVKRAFLNGAITVEDDSFRFREASAVNSYTVALVTNFLQNEYIRQGHCFSQETVFSHPSKLAALAEAKRSGFRTYLYFVATSDSALNVARVENRASQGGHNVPGEKITSRYARSLANVRPALEHLSRAFFFDNSGEDMRYVAQWNPEAGLVSASPDQPEWFRRLEI